MVFDIGIGAANALINVILWVVHAVISQMMEKTYSRLARVQMKDTGRTDATDSNEVHFLSWIFRFSMYRRRQRSHKTIWWAVILMLLLFFLLPAELLLEAGLYERHNCTKKTVRSKGVCASPWRGEGDVFVSSAMLMTQRAGWVSQNWEAVFEGSRKMPRISETHSMTPEHAKNRRVVLAQCSVYTSRCTTDCGTLTVAKTLSPYSTIVTSASIYNSSTEKRFCVGDVTYDGSLGAAFMFCSGQSATMRTGNRRQRNRISTQGIEHILSRDDVHKKKLGSTTPWRVQTSYNRTRLYNIICSSDGLLPRDLTKAVSMYRTTQMEQPGVRRKDVGHLIEKLSPLNVTDTLKAAFSLKAEDNSETCSGNVDIYTTCGDFKLPLMLPFICMSLFLIILWLAFKLHLSDYTGNDVLPFDCPSWRQLAHNQAMILKRYREVKFDFSHTGDDFTVARYSEEKYPMDEIEKIPGAVLSTKTLSPADPRDDIWE